MTASTFSLEPLKVALEANSAAYRRAVQTSAPGECWDFVVLTAANETQAAGYRQELALRHRVVGSTGAFFPAIQRSLVVADPPGRRAGSGGATFAVLKALSQQFDLQGSDFDRLRILLIHSGGASQRLPMYSPVGKIFAPLPLLRPDGQIATLFDHLYLTLAGLPDRLGPGMLVLAGDVFLLLDHRHVTRPEPGVSAISMRVEPELGEGHGVFVTNAQSAITHTLQKVSTETMKQRGAMDDSGKVLIDTGLLFFDAPRTRQLAGLAGSASRRGIQDRHVQQIDLYEDMTEALAAGTVETAFLADVSKRAMRRELWKALHKIPFRAMQLDGQFLHLGTTLQFRDAMVGHNPSPAAELFQQNVLAHSQWTIAAGRRVYHSVLLADGGASGQLGESSVVEHSLLRAPASIGKGCVVSQVEALTQELHLDDDRLLFQAPVRPPTKATAGKPTRVRPSGRRPKPVSPLLYVHVYAGVKDDFKGRFDQKQCAYLNAPMENWMQSHGVVAKDLWPAESPDKRTLWTARLFVATPKRDMAPSAIAFNASPKPKRSELARWRKAPRYSMAMILEQAEAQALIEHREVVAAHLQASELIEAIRRREDRPVESVVGRYQTSSAYRASEDRLRQFAQGQSVDANSAIDQARAFWTIAQLQQRPDHPDHTARQHVDAGMSEAFAKIAQASEIGHRVLHRPASGSGRLPREMEIVATAPVRLDLAGGWTDTPPYCFERGGHVVNVAIDLDGRPPVRSIVGTLSQPRLILESHDLGATIEVTEIDLPDAPVNVRDPFALHKVALQLTGLLPTQHRDVRKHLKSLGAGLRIVTECRVPKGSGLGTSSILAATLLAGLHRLRGVEPTVTDLIDQVLTLEQRLSTGGGWQDQVGGIVGGVKSTITGPGVPQRPVVETLALSDAQFQSLQERLVVYYSGQQRLARDILRRVMGRWLAREPAIVMLQEELKQGAAGLRTQLLRGNWAESARHIARYWQIKKELFPGSTTPTIDVLLLEMRDDYLAAGLAGAGGGGFAYFVCADAAQASRLRSRLAERSNRPGSLGSVYPTQINRAGLQLTVGKPQR